MISLSRVEAGEDVGVAVGQLLQPLLYSLLCLLYFPQHGHHCRLALTLSLQSFLLLPGPPQLVSRVVQRDPE